MSLAMNLRTLFCILGVTMVGTFIYTVSVYGLPFRSDIFYPWVVVTLIDCSIINGILIGAWVSYKESSWATALIWIMFLICFQSVTVCVYIVFQIYKLSAEASSLDPIYNILVRRSSKNGVENERCISISAAKVFFVTLGCPILGLVIFGFVKGFPISDIFAPWMTASLVNFNISITAVSIWVIYKESSWFRAFIWIFPMMIIGSPAICAYVVKQLCYLLPQDPVYLVLFNSSNRKSETTKQLLGDLESADQ